MDGLLVMAGFLLALGVGGSIWNLIGHTRPIKQHFDTFFNSLPTFVQDETEQGATDSKSEIHSIAMASLTAALDESILDSETFTTKIQDFQKFVMSATQQRPLLVDAQMHTEAEIKDIEHAIEFYNYNAAEGYKMFRRLKDARMRRRQYKDAIAWIDILMESNPKPVAEANTVNRIRGMQHRQYAPAALPELFTKERPVN